MKILKHKNIMPIEDEFNPSADSPFVSGPGQDNFDAELSRRTRVVVTPDVHEETKPTLKDHWNELSAKEKGKLALTGAVVTAAAIGGVAVAPEAIDRFNGPEFSADTTTYSVQPGDGWYDVIEGIEGYEAIDRNVLISHVKADPANIDFLTGDLQPGQSITIPISVEK